MSKKHLPLWFYASNIPCPVDKVIWKLRFGWWSVRDQLFGPGQVRF